MPHSFAALFAASSNPGQTIGDNLKDLVQGFAVPAWLAIAICVGIALALGRNIPKLFIAFAVLLFCGILVMDPEAFARFAKSVGNALTQGL